MNWTAQEIRALRHHWPRLSASEIGAVLGKSRNAVIGKVHRLSLPAKTKAAKTAAHSRGAHEAFQRKGRA